MDKTREYAQSRANETGRPYLITVFGHCFMDCASNRKLALNPAIGEGIAYRVLPNYTHCLQTARAAISRARGAAS